MTEPKNIPMKEWGKDHWSLLLYIETRCVDYHGILDDTHMRNKRHTEGARAWSSDYTTRLFGFWKEGSKDTDKTRTAPYHDDYDCLDDIEAEGLAQNVGSGLNPQCVMTDLGYKYLTQLRKWKADGNHCASFVPSV